MVRKEISKSSFGEGLWFIVERVGRVNFDTDMVEWSHYEFFVEMLNEGLFPTVFDSNHTSRRRVTHPNVLIGLVQDGLRLRTT